MNNEATTNENNPESIIGLPCEHNGFLWTVAAHAKGWYTLTSSDGQEVKRRRKDFELLEDEDEANASKQMSDTLKKYREKYVPSLAHSGKKSLNCGDRLAQVLEGMSYEDVFALAEYWCELASGSLWAKYAHLKNDGMRRMNAGNRLRRLVRIGQEEIPEDGEDGSKAYQFCEWLQDDDAIAASKIEDGTFYRIYEANEA